MNLHVHPGLWRGSAVVLCSLAASVALVVLLQPFLHEKAHLLPFTLAVITASFYGGLIAGCVTTLLSFVIADLFFVEPLFKMLTTPNDYVLMAVFLLFGVSLSIANHALRKANHTVVKRSEALERSNEELRHFAYGVSHDLREPLRGIRSFTQLLLRSTGAVDQQSKEILDFILSSATRMARLVDSILEFAKAGDSASEEMSEVDMRALANEAVSHLHSAIGEKKAHVRIEDLPLVRGNQEQLFRVFLNLIANAIKYQAQDARPEVVVSGADREGESIFSVRDNGIGIPVQYHERIFGAFQRVHSRSEYEGCGLGLAACKRVVEQHGGRIWVESTLGQGSTFSFAIPRVRKLQRLG